MTVHDSLHETSQGPRPRRHLLAIGLTVLVTLAAGCGENGAEGDEIRAAEADRTSAGEPLAASAETSRESATEEPGGDAATVVGPADDETPAVRRSAVEVLLEREPAPFPTDWLESEPLIGEIIEEGWARSPIARGELDRVVAVVDGEELTGLDLAKECLLRWGGVPFHHQIPFDDLARELLSLAEARHAGFEITDDEVEAVVNQSLRKIGSRDFEHHEVRTGECEPIVRLKAKGELARRKLFARDKGRPEFREKDALEYIEWSPHFVAHYPHALASEYGYARLPDGAAALMNGVPLSLDIALPYVLSCVGPIQREISLDDLIDATVLDQELARRGVTVDPVEVDAIVAQRERTKAGGLIPWRLLLRSKGTADKNRGVSVGYVRRMFRCWIAVDQIEGEVSDDDVLRYFERQSPMIGRASVRLASIRFPLRDGRENPLGPIEEAKVRLALDKALDELRGGADFYEVVAKYSRDAETRRWTEVDGVEGRVCGDIGLTNVRDGMIREEIAAAGFLARRGQWIGPIRTPHGYEIVMPFVVREPAVFPLEDEVFTDMNSNGRYDPDEPFDDANFNSQWDAGRRFFALNEARRDRALAFLAEARAKADIEIRQER